MGGFEWPGNQLLHLGAEGLLSDIRTCPQDMKQFLSEMWVLIGKLEGKGWEDHVKVAPILKVL